MFDSPKPIRGEASDFLISSSEISKYAKSIQDFDEVCVMVLQALDDVVKGQSELHIDDLQLCGAELVREFGIFVDSVQEQEGEKAEERAIITGVLLHEQWSRHDSLRHLLPDVDFSKRRYDKNEVDIDIKEMYSLDSIGALRKNLLDYFLNDLEEFIEFTTSQLHETTERAPLEVTRMRDMIGKYAVRAIAFSAIAIGGIVVSKLILRKEIS